mmetsp:Transcript_60258/g.197008  ORF Transcript_60258/g.197008 Transcript_60258/m.197008 type:complete len:691 (+) Transcript_60258:343-2415(+)
MHTGVPTGCDPPPLPKERCSKSKSSGGGITCKRSDSCAPISGGRSALDRRNSSCKVILFRMRSYTSAARLTAWPLIRSNSSPAWHPRQGGDPEMTSTLPLPEAATALAPPLEEEATTGACSHIGLSTKASSSGTCSAQRPPSSMQPVNAAPSSASTGGAGEVVSSNTARPSASSGMSSSVSSSSALTAAAAAPKPPPPPPPAVAPIVAEEAAPAAAAQGEATKGGGGRKKAKDAPAAPALPPGVAPAGTPPQEKGRCTYFVAGKGRYCRFHASPGGERCGAHLAEPEDDQQRVPCPLDGGHTVYKNRLAQHLKICSKKRQDEILVRQPFFKKGVNGGGGAQAELDQEDRQLEAEVDGSLAGLDLQDTFLVRLAAAFPRAVAEVLGPSVDPEELLARSVVATAGNLAHAEKHEAQNLALTAMISERGLLEGDPVVVEYGCGRAGLATAVLAEKPGIRCVLVDRDAPRNKMEHRQEHRGERVLRLRLDIADFDLAALLQAPLDPAALPRAADFKGEALQVSSTTDANGNSGPAERLEELWKAAAALQAAAPWPPSRLLACAKHLCGGATDIALRSLQGRPGGVEASVCIATCCHHRCDSVSYLNVPFLQRLGLCEAEGEFARLASLAGWAVGGRGDVRAKRHIGMMAKRILDLGRVAWLREAMGLKDAALAEYIGKEVTPENIAIVASGARS